MIKIKKVFVGMSGGVDSSVAAALLQKQGYQVTGVHLRCYNVDGCAEQDAEDARRAAEALKIPFYVLDFEKEYKAKVVEYMVAGYKNGETPNPDVMCNREIKFGLFYQAARELGADFIATGHYVRLASRKSKTSHHSHSKISHRLFTALDKNKDQSYFLWMLTQDQLDHCLFPIGDYTKPEVRRFAKKFKLPNAEKKDSQGICFLGKVSLTDFLAKYIKPKKGAVLDPEGNIIGEHRGAAFYTIGQRHGFNLSPQPSNLTPNSRPRYISAKDVIQNTITVAEGADHPELSKKEVMLTDLHFISPPAPSSTSKFPTSRLLPPAPKPIPVFARLRYRQPLAKAMLYLKVDNDKSLNQKKSRHSHFKISHRSFTATLTFDRPQKFVAPGQSAVFYSKSGEMLGGGVIS